MTLRELIDNSVVPVTVIDSKTGRRALIECYGMNSKAEKYGDIEVYNISIDVSRFDTGFSVTLRPYIKVYAYHDDIQRARLEGVEDNEAD